MTTSSRSHSGPAHIERHLLLVWVLALVAAAAVTVVSTATGDSPASAFGTIRKAGQKAEHERITRAALHCPNATTLAGNGCFQAKSLTQLAGTNGTFGGVGYPDRFEIKNPSAHCDDADYLPVAGYPQGSGSARIRLVSCIRHLRGAFHAAITAADGLVDADNNVVASALPKPKAVCVAVNRVDNSVKCRVITGFGRALHGVQDFYSHSNYTDRAGSPASVRNPPGLGLSAPAALLNLTPVPSATVPPTPAGLSTGCFALPDTAKGWWGCTARITHSTLNKDKGTIDPVSGAATRPTTPRGCGPMSDNSRMRCGVPTATGANFAAAVHGAIADTARQWTDFKTLLVAEYGSQRGTTMACAITHDNPLVDCGHAALLYKAVIHLTSTCTGSCGGAAGSTHDYQESETFTVVADVPLTTLPADSSSPAATGAGSLEGSPFSDTVNTGTISDTYTNEEAPVVCFGTFDGTHTATLVRIDKGIFSDVAVTAQGPAGGPPTTMGTTFRIEDPAAVPDPSAADMWHDVWVNTNADDPTCNGTSELTQNHRMLVFAIRFMHADLGELVNQGVYHVAGLPVTPEATDRVIAARHKDWTGQGGGSGSVLNATVAEDIQIVTNDACDPSGQPPAPLVDCREANTNNVPDPTHASAPHRPHNRAGQTAAIIAAVQAWHHRFVTSHTPTCAGLTKPAQQELTVLTWSKSCTQAARRLLQFFSARDKRAFQHVTISPKQVTVSGSHAVVAAGAIHYNPNPSAFVRLTEARTLTRTGGKWLIDSVVQGAD